MNFFVQNWIVLFAITSWCIIFVHSKEIELLNWIEISKGNWPPSIGHPKEPFLVYHSEYEARPLIGLKQTFFDDLKVVDNVELSFKYWASNGGSLRCRIPNNGPVKRDIRLSKGGDSWHSTDDLSNLNIGGTVLTHLKNISKEEWANFAFVSQDLFTLALKDVRVKYVDGHTGLLIEVTCNPTTGCDHIFNRKLPISRLMPESGRYVPFQIDSNNSKNIELEFARNQTHNEDFCIDFVYVGKEVPLEVKLEADPGLLFPTTTFVPQKRTVCASWLKTDISTSADDVPFSFTFGFSPIYDIDNHFVKDLKVRPTPKQHSVCHCEVGWTGEACDKKV